MSRARVNEEMPSFDSNSDTRRAAQLTEARRLAAVQPQAPLASRIHSLGTSVLQQFNELPQQGQSKSGVVLDLGGGWHATPLVEACTKGNVALVEELLALGASPLLAAGREDTVSNGYNGVFFPDELVDKAANGLEGFLAEGVLIGVDKAVNEDDLCAAYIKASKDFSDAPLLSNVGEAKRIAKAESELEKLRNQTTPLLAAVCYGELYINLRR